MIELGQKIAQRIECGKSSEGGERMDVPMVGTVIWVHPKKRFYVVQFQNGLKESYFMRRCEYDG